MIHYGFGMFLTTENVKCFVNSYNMVMGYEYDSYKNMYEIMEDIEQEIIDDYCTDSMFISVDNDEYLPAYGAFLFAKNQPEAFKSPYNDIDEVIAEMKSEYGEYLPSNFNYKAHIRYIEFYRLTYYLTKHCQYFICNYLIKVNYT